MTDWPLKMRSLSCALWISLPLTLLCVNDSLADTTDKAELQPLDQWETFQYHRERAFVVGTAKSRDGKSIRYYETYDHDPGTNSFIVRYWSADGEPVSHKAVNPSAIATIPDIDFVDYRRSDGFSIRSSADSVDVKRFDFSDPPVYAKRKMKTDAQVALKNTVVVDAGFDRYVLQNWQKLIDGKSGRFSFLQIGKARLVPLKIELTECSVEMSAESVCFRLNIANRLLKRFVKPIELAYDRQSKRLLRFAGLGPLKNSKGKGMTVDIRYKYADG